MLLYSVTRFNYSLMGRGTSWVRSRLILRIVFAEYRVLFTKGRSILIIEMLLKYSVFSLNLIIFSILILKYILII
ncbi:hypothetical protein BCE_3141 [Bacillus cereus ATCC 10987]|uniref:Uncharacterized protein n=1 Tax=Bacillus cereus (strain ATCC 10987 / NRS 248) TaxID=222523 RepID=Q735L1_BACC1|nr:hypothetical protein BCE_3141 [Bacillus cereus ATCC 10987]